MGIDGDWCHDIIRQFQLPDIFEELVEPGTVIGNIRPEIAPQPNMANVPVIAACSHDTAAVAAAVPASGDNWAFISSGTWSILGRLRSEPVTTPNSWRMDLVMNIRSAVGFCAVILSVFG